MKKIMILGATLTQIPLIQEAKRLGYWTIVASIDGDYPGFDYADEKCVVDITNRDEVLKKAKELKIDGIATCCMDTPVRALGYVCQKMGLCGLTENAAILCNDKLLMKKAFIKYGVKTALFKEIHNNDELNEAINTMKVPLVIKAVDLQASRGVYVLQTKEEAFACFKKVMSLTKKDYCIIEEFIKGDELGAQAFVYNNEILFVLPHGDFTVYRNTAIPVGHFAPLNMDENVLNKAISEAQKAIRAVGLNNCAVNIDMIYKDGEIYLIELTGRAGATNLCEMTSIYYGINYYTMIVQTAMGEDPRDVFNKKSQNTTPNASKFIMSKKTGILQEINNLNNIQDNVCEYKIFVKKGDAIREFTDGKDRLGHVIIKDATIEQCLASINNYCDNIEIIVK